MKALPLPSSLPVCLLAGFLVCLMPAAILGQPPAPPPWPTEPGASAWKELKGQLDTLGAIQSAPLPDTVTVPPHPPAWPGMNRFDVITGLDVLAQAGVVVLRSADGKRQPVWIRSLRGYRKANGWYGILLNGQEIKEDMLYLMYGGREINFQQLMTWGSRIFTESAPFQTDP